MKTLLERIADMAACVEGNVEEVLLDAAKEIKRLQVKIEAVEKQEPVATVDANDEGYWAEILPDRSVRVGQKLYALPGAQPSYLPSDLAEAIIADMQAQYDSELITENDSCEALIRLDGAIAAVEDNFAAATEAKP